MKKPLADRFRPQSLDDIVGQKHLLGKDRPLRKIMESGDIPNLIFYGPSGVGKTTVASYIARRTNKTLKKLNGTTASTADIKEIVAQLGTFEGLNGILLYLDEIQYFNKKQQQTLLEYMENGSITLIASTTENPYFYVYNAILSRSTVFEFKSVEPDEVARAVRRAASMLEQEQEITITMEEDCAEKIAVGCGGDVRKAMNALELAAIATDCVNGEKHILTETAEALSQKSAMRYDRDGDEHYDIVSAYQKKYARFRCGRGAALSRKIVGGGRFALRVSETDGVCLRGCGACLSAGDPNCQSLRGYRTGGRSARSTDPACGRCDSCLQRAEIQFGLCCCRKGVA